MMRTVTTPPTVDEVRSALADGCCKTLGAALHLALPVDQSVVQAVRFDQGAVLYRSVWVQLTGDYAEDAVRVAQAGYLPGDVFLDLNAPRTTWGKRVPAGDGFIIMGMVRLWKARTVFVELDVPESVLDAVLEQEIAGTLSVDAVGVYEEDGKHVFVEQRGHALVLRTYSSRGPEHVNQPVTQDQILEWALEASSRVGGQMQKLDVLGESPEGGMNVELTVLVHGGLVMLPGSVFTTSYLTGFPVNPLPVDGDAPVGWQHVGLTDGGQYLVRHIASGVVGEFVR